MQPAEDGRNLVMRNLKRQVVNAQLEDFIAPVAGELLGWGLASR